MTTDGSKRLLVAIINDPDTIDEILSGFIELGITGATILNSEGMGSVLSHDIPIFAGLQTLISGSRSQNRMIFTELPASLVDSAVELLQEISGDLEKPATGIVFTLPVDRVEGLAPELGGEGNPI